MSDIEIRPMGPVIGAEIHGVDLGGDLSKKILDQVEKALVDHLVLAFKGQDITPDQHLDFGRHFGEVYCPPMSAFPPEHPEIMLLDTTTPKGAGADNWHYDATFMPEPPMASVLRPVLLPAGGGGDTCFANMYEAFEALSEPMREMLDGRNAVHDLSGQLRISVDRGISPDGFEELTRKWPPMEHPVVRTHPVTGRKALFLNKVTGSRIVGLSDRENDLLVPFLLDHVRDPAFQCRMRWTSDTILMWDNRCTQHCGVPDFTDRRIMHRVTIAGDRPR
ncbi:MAG: TauD/TfdA family dioxygenase [bacterium]|nr:TauD/TfdA family dioxygenase [bacterium]